jgi:hypothetical protein
MKYQKTSFEILQNYQKHQKTNKLCNLNMQTSILSTIGCILMIFALCITIGFNVKACQEAGNSREVCLAVEG